MPMNAVLNWKPSMNTYVMLDFFVQFFVYIWGGDGVIKK